MFHSFQIDFDFCFQEIIIYFCFSEWEFSSKFYEMCFKISRKYKKLLLKRNYMKGNIFR